MENILQPIISSAQGDRLLPGQGGQEVCGAEGDLVDGSGQLTSDQVWGLLYTNTMVRVELGSGVDQRSRQAILAYIGSGHRSDVQTPTTSLRFVVMLPNMLFSLRVSVLPSEMRSVEDFVLHSPFLVTIVVSR